LGGAETENDDRAEVDDEEVGWGGGDGNNKKR
jgi:hypothetical protein